jgi:hypothetical protein
MLVPGQMKSSATWQGAEKVESGRVRIETTLQDESSS